MFIKTLKKQATVLAAASLLAFAGTASAANVLVNAGFEDPSLGGAAEAPGAGSGWSSWGDWGGPFTISDFTSAGPAFEGVQMLKAFGPSGVFQEFSTTGGDTWAGDFWAKNDAADAMAGDQVVGVDIVWFSGGIDMGMTVFGDTMDASAPLDIWTNLAVSGVAPAGADTARIVFYTYTGGAGGGAPKFDDTFFELTGGAAIPVPAAAWLFGSALAGLVAVRRKK